MKITQPAVKQRLLDSFADDCDSQRDNDHGVFNCPYYFIRRRTLNCHVRYKVRYFTHLRLNFNYEL